MARPEGRPAARIIALVSATWISLLIPDTRKMTAMNRRPMKTAIMDMVHPPFFAPRPLVQSGRLGGGGGSAGQCGAKLRLSTAQSPHVTARRISGVLPAGKAMSAIVSSCHVGEAARAIGRRSEEHTS